MRSCVRTAWPPRASFPEISQKAICLQQQNRACTAYEQPTGPQHSSHGPRSKVRWLACCAMATLLFLRPKITETLRSKRLLDWAFGNAVLLFHRPPLTSQARRDAKRQNLANNRSFSREALIRHRIDAPDAAPRVTNVVAPIWCIIRHYRAAVRTKSPVLSGRDEPGYSWLKFQFTSPTSMNMIRLFEVRIMPVRER